MGKRITLELHDIYNRSRDIDRSLEDAIDEAERTGTKTVELIPGKGSRQLKKRVLRLLDGKDIKARYHRVEKDRKNFGRVFVHFNHCLRRAPVDADAALTFMCILLPCMVLWRSETREGGHGREAGRAGRERADRRPQVTGLRQDRVTRKPWRRRIRAPGSSSAAASRRSSIVSCGSRTGGAAAAGSACRSVGRTRRGCLTRPISGFIRALSTSQAWSARVRGRVSVTISNRPPGRSRALASARAVTVSMWCREATIVTASYWPARAGSP